jgi:hypothetical protein
MKSMFEKRIIQLIILKHSNIFFDVIKFIAGYVVNARVALVRIIVDGQHLDGVAPHY